MLTIDDQDNDGPRLIEATESKSGYNLEVKDQKNIDFNIWLWLVIDGLNKVRPQITWVGESESGYKFGLKG